MLSFQLASRQHVERNSIVLQSSYPMVSLHEPQVREGEVTIRRLAKARIKPNLREGQAHGWRGRYAIMKPMERLGLLFTRGGVAPAKVIRYRARVEMSEGTLKRSSKEMVVNYWQG